MRVEKISIGRGKKLSINYNSYDYHVGVTIELEEGDEFDKALQFAQSNLKVLEYKEVLKLKEEIA